MSGGASFSRIGVHVGADWLVRCSTYLEGTPILAIDTGRIMLNISIEGKDADQSAVDFARALVRNGQAFASAVERIHAEHATADTTRIPNWGPDRLLLMMG